MIVCLIRSVVCLYHLQAGHLQLLQLGGAEAGGQAVGGRVQGGQLVQVLQTVWLHLHCRLDGFS